MKTILTTIILAVIAIAAEATPVTFTWDASATATFYNFYEVTAGVPQKISTTSGTTVTREVAVGTHTYYVTASNAAGESEPSTPVAVVIAPPPPPTPAAPTNLKAVVKSP